MGMQAMVERVVLRLRVLREAGGGCRALPRFVACLDGHDESCGLRVAPLYTHSAADVEGSVAVGGRAYYEPAY
jgi:hypothetical protein